MPRIPPRSRASRRDVGSGSSDSSNDENCLHCAVCLHRCSSLFSLSCHMRPAVPGSCGHPEGRVPCPWRTTELCRTLTIPAALMETHREAVHPNSSVRGPVQLGAAADSGGRGRAHSFDGLGDDSQQAEEGPLRLSPDALVHRPAVVLALRNGRPPAAVQESGGPGDESSGLESTGTGSDDSGSDSSDDSDSSGSASSDSSSSRDGSEEAAFAEEEEQEEEKGEELPASDDENGMDVAEEDSDAGEGGGGGGGDEPPDDHLGAAEMAAANRPAAQLLKLCLDNNMSQKGITVLLQLAATPGFDMGGMPSKYGSLRRRAEHYVHAVTSTGKWDGAPPAATTLRCYKCPPEQFGLEGLTTRSYVPVYIRDLKAVLIERLQSLRRADVVVEYEETFDWEGNRWALNAQSVAPKRLLSAMCLTVVSGHSMPISSALSMHWQCTDWCCCCCPRSLLSPLQDCGCTKHSRCVEGRGGEGAAATPPRRWQVHAGPGLQL